MSTHNLQNHQRTILSAVIAKELIGYTKTPRKARSIYNVKQSSAHFKHFEILRLTEDFSYQVASQLYQDDSFNPERLKGLIVGNYAQILTYSGLTRDMFAEWFSHVIGAHYTGIMAKKRSAANPYASAASTASTKPSAAAKTYDPDFDDDGLDYVEQPIPPAKPILFDPNARLPEYKTDYPTATYNPYGAAAAYDPEFYGEGFYDAPSYGAEHNNKMSEEEAIILATLLSFKPSSQNRVGTRTYRAEERSAFDDEGGIRKGDPKFTEQLLPDDSSEFSYPNTYHDGDLKSPIELAGLSDASEDYELGVYVSPEDREAQEHLLAEIEQQRQDRLRLKEIERAQQEAKEHLAAQRHQEEQRRLKEEEERLAAEQMITPISNPSTVSIKIGELLDTLDSAAKDTKETGAAEMSVTINEHTWTVSVENYAEFKERFKGTYNPELLIGPFNSTVTENKIKTRFSAYRFQKANGDIIELTLTLKRK